MTNTRSDCSAVVDHTEMVLLCQKNSFLKEHKAKVIECIQKDNKPHPNYHVKLEDTIFFPEGGGQHCDMGTLGDANVSNVYRDGDEAVHVVDKAFSVGEKVHLKIDWGHRLDQMQQHSGQHLLSAIVNHTLGYETVSWDCGTDECNVELDTKDLSEENMSLIEELCNEKIRQAINVSASVYELGDPNLDIAHTRGLPKDHKGAIRIVSIDGLDHNLCCGTHVSNLGQLQAIKLLRTSRGNKGRTLLHFVVGVRLLKKMKDIYNREKQMSIITCGNPENHLELVKKNIITNKKSIKYLQSVLKDLAILEVNALQPDSPYTFTYRKEGDNSYINSYLSEFKKKMVNPDALLVIVTGEKDDGNLLIYRKSGNVDPIGKLVCENKLLDGNGKGRDSQYSAKIKHVERYTKADEVIRQHLNKKTEA